LYYTNFYLLVFLLNSVHPVGVHLIGMHFVGVPLMERISWTCLS